MTTFIDYDTALGIANDVYGETNFNVHGVIPDGWQLDRSLDAAGPNPGEIISLAGFYVYALKPSGADDGRRVLAFRGTGPNFPDILADVFADVTDVDKTRRRPSGGHKQRIAISAGTRRAHSKACNEKRCLQCEPSNGKQK